MPDKFITVRKNYSNIILDKFRYLVTFIIYNSDLVGCFSPLLCQTLDLIFNLIELLHTFGEIKFEFNQLNLILLSLAIKTH